MSLITFAKQKAKKHSICFTYVSLERFRSCNMADFLHIQHIQEILAMYNSIAEKKSYDTFKYLIEIA